MSWAAAIGGIAGGAIDYRTKRKDREYQRTAHLENIANQKEFAKYGIQWKVQDAKKAGIHPLAALGASTHSYTPQNVGGGGSSSNFGHLGSVIGKNIASVVGSKEEEKLRHENMRLNNDLLRQQVNTNRNPVSNPDAVITGQQTSSPGATPGTQKLLVDIPYKNQPGVQSGTQPLYTNTIDDRGRARLTTTEQSSQMIGEEAPMQVGIPSTMTGLADWAKDAFAIYQNKNDPRHFRDKKFKSLIKFARNARKHLPPPRKGFQWRYNAFGRYFKQVRQTNGRSKLFVHKLPFDVH